MSILKERNNLSKKNPFPKENIHLINKVIKLSPPTPSLLKKNKREEESLEYISGKIYQTPNNNNLEINTPKKMNFKSKKLYTSKELKPSLTLGQKNFEKITFFNEKIITEKIPENNLRKSTKIPTDNLILNNQIRNPKIMVSNNKAENKIEDAFFSIPLDNINSMHKSPKIKNYKKNNVFSELKDSNKKYNRIDIIINDEMKISKKIDKNKILNEVKHNLNEELKKIKIKKPQDKISRNVKNDSDLINLTENRKETSRKDGKLIKMKKEKKLVKLQNQINNTDSNEKNNINEEKSKEKINKKSNLKNKDIKEDKSENIEINIIKNDISKTIIIRNLEKEKDEKKNNITNTKEERQEIINSNKLEINNNSEIKTENKSVEKKKNKNSKRSNKIYDITFDEIKEDTNIKPQQIKHSNIQENYSKIKLPKTDIDYKSDKSTKTSKKNEQKNIDKEKKPDFKKNIPLKKQEEINLNNNEQINIVEPIILSLNNIENSQKEKQNQPENKLKTNNKDIIEDKNNTKKEENENKKDNTKIKNNELKPINYNFIRDIIQRYEDSPPQQIIKSKSGIFSQNNKNSSSFIFNKIISFIENKNKLISKSIKTPMNHKGEIGIQFNPNDFKYLGIIGKGEYGKIYLVQWITNNNQFYAMKYEKFKDLEEAQKNQIVTHIIMDFILKTRSEGVIKIYGDILLKNKNIYHYYTLMEKSERDVEQECIIRNKYMKYYTEKNLIDILCQLIITCSSLQKYNICHGDIKPQNILILNGYYKLSDFGEVKIIEQGGLIEQDIGGTELYMSPKLFFAMKKKEKSVIHNAYKSDVFSLALCILLMATFDYEILVEIRELTDMEKLKNIVKDFLSKRYSDNLIMFLFLMLEIDEDKRFDFIQLENKLVKKKK